MVSFEEHSFAIWRLIYQEVIMFVKQEIIVLLANICLSYFRLHFLMFKIIFLIWKKGESCFSFEKLNVFVLWLVVKGVDNQSLLILKQILGADHCILFHSFYYFYRGLCINEANINRSFQTSKQAVKNIFLTRIYVILNESCTHKKN